jgi:hypothetical protein
MVENQVEEYYLEQAEADNRMDKKPIIWQGRRIGGMKISMFEHLTEAE